MGGSAGVGVLLLAAIPDHVEGVVALVVFAFFTAVSMAIASSSFGYALSRGPVLRRFVAVAPVLGVVSIAFGAWYALGALNAIAVLLLSRGGRPVARDSLTIPIRRTDWEATAG